jgi:hypothetical protein
MGELLNSSCDFKTDHRKRAAVRRHEGIIAFPNNRLSIKRATCLHFIPRRPTNRPKDLYVYCLSKRAFKLLNIEKHAIFCVAAPGLIYSSNVGGTQKLRKILRNDTRDLALERLSPAVLFSNGDLIWPYPNDKLWSV